MKRPQETKKVSQKGQPRKPEKQCVMEATDTECLKNQISQQCEMLATSLDQSETNKHSLDSGQEG